MDEIELRGAITSLNDIRQTMKSILLPILLVTKLIQGDAKAISIPPRSSALLHREVPRGGGQPAKADQVKTSNSSAITAGLKNTLASGLAAACSKTILAPFDTIKTVQQDVTGGTSLSLVQAVKKICGRDGGIRNLYVSCKFLFNIH